MHLTKNGILCRLQHNIQKSYLDIGTKIILELNSFCLKNNVMLKNGEDACDEAYSMNFLNDSELLDFGFAFNQCLSLGTCALIKQYSKHVNTIHVLISYTMIYGSLIIPNIHFHMQ